MERNGFMLDTSYCARGLQVARADEAQCLSDLRANLAAKLGELPPNPDDIWTSTQQLAFTLEYQMGLPPSPYKVKGKVDLDAGKRSTDKRAIEWILSRAGDDQPSRRVLEGIARLRGIRNSAKYLEKFPRFVGPDGLVHPVCGPAGDSDDRVGAVTGRFGMKNPEGQQIPRDPKKDRYFIRRAFIAPPGMKLIIADYTALEVVVLANICEWLFDDTLLLDLTGPGQDIHAANAHGIFGVQLNWKTDSGRPIKDFPDQKLYKTDPELAWYRDLVKAVWYKLQYGGTVHGFATSLRDKDGEPVGMARAEEIVGALYAACPPIRKWHDWVRADLREHGTSVALDGRMIDLSETIQQGKWGLEAACRVADNHPMQGTGAAVIGNAMVSVMECPEVAHLGGLTQLQIHDELQLRGPEANAARLAVLLKEHMEAAYPLKNLRSTVGIGDNWNDAKS